MSDPVQDIPGLAARLAALRLIDAVLRRGETLERAGVGALSALTADHDRALARAIAGETLRWLIDLDAMIDGATTLPEDAKARSVLRLMLAQWLRLGAPPHAVIATALPLLAGGPRRLAHGVFSTLVKRAVPLPAVPTLPDAVIARWGERAAGIATALAEPPPLDLTLRDAAETAVWTERLGGVSLLPGHVRLPRGGSVERLPGFAEGAWWVQDIAASLPARLLGAGEAPGGPKRVLDLCAAPGGKAMQLAAAGWRVTALDMSDKRLHRLRQNCARTNLAVETVVGDALTWEPEGPFDAVLLDAPCTATGTCRRHPDVLHRIGARQIAEMAEMQTRMLARAERWVAPGGRLVYAVCSLEREEGEAVAGRCGLAVDPIAGEGLPDGIMPTAEGRLRTDPGMLIGVGGMDGFFVARWRG